MQYVLGRGVPARKILMGIPTYGRSFKGARRIGEAFQKHEGEEGVFEYRDLPLPASEVHFDEDAGAAFCVGSEGGFATYDDVRSVEAKAAFAKEQGLAGLFYWTGTGDKDGDESLVATGWKVLRLGTV